MEPKIYMNYIHPSSLLKQLSQLWKTDQLCDAVITVDKLIVAKAHKVVLFAISSKLKEDSSQATQSPILDVRLPSGITHKSVHAFLKYLYEGYLVLTKQIAEDMLKISSFLQIKCLSNCCNDYLDSLNDDVILLDDDIPTTKEPKSEEFGHVRTSDPDDIPKTQTDSVHSVHSVHDSSKRKKRRKSGSPPTSHQPSQSPVERLKPSHIHKASDVSESEPSPRKFIKPEPGEMASCQGEEFKITDASGRQISSSSNLSSVNLSNLKEEPQDEFFQSITQTGNGAEYGDQGMTGDDSHYGDNSMGGGEMWYDETGGVQTLNQTAPVESMSSPMGAGYYPPRTMTPSLNQIRAQQSIKRSIQSSQSAARKARNIAGASATMAAPPSEPGENQGEQSTDGGSQEAPIQCRQCLRTYRTLGSYKHHFYFHHSDKIYPCVICGREFRKKSSMHRHQSVHSKPINITEYQPGLYG